MNILEATRAWIRGSGKIDKNNRFNVNYIGATATEYSVNTAGDSHRQDIFGKDKWTANFVFSARMPYGETLTEQITAADFFLELCAWIRAQNTARNFPTVAGYRVTGVTPANAGMLISADANTAQYQLQIQLKLEEL
jgi:hypothetical protein